MQRESSRLLAPALWALPVLIVGLLVSARHGEAASALEDFELEAEVAEHHELHKKIREISGLATTADGRILAHDDERAIIFEIDPATGKLVKAFAFGKPVAVGDFEGIAVVEGVVYLVTSAGGILRGREGDRGKHQSYQTGEIDVPKRCEIEGLDYDPARGGLVLVCKQPRGSGDSATVVAYLYSIETGEAIEKLSWRLADLSKGIKGKDFHPSGIAVHPVTGNYFMVAAQESAIAEVTPEGEVVSVRRLPAKVHRQVEGITFDAQGALILADEGGDGGKARARLTRYPN